MMVVEGGGEALVSVWHLASVLAWLEVMIARGFERVGGITREAWLIYGRPRRISALTVGTGGSGHHVRALERGAEVGLGHVSGGGMGWWSRRDYSAAKAPPLTD
jgi:hypothetical protein